MNPARQGMKHRSEARAEALAEARTELLTEMRTSAFAKTSADTTPDTKVSVREPETTHSQKPPTVLAFGMLRIPGVSSKAPLTLPKAVFATPSETVRNTSLRALCS